MHLNSRAKSESCLSAALHFETNWIGGWSKTHFTTSRPPAHPATQSSSPAASLPAAATAHSGAAARSHRYPPPAPPACSRTGRPSGGSSQFPVCAVPPLQTRPAPQPTAVALQVSQNGRIQLIHPARLHGIRQFVRIFALSLTFRSHPSVLLRTLHTSKAPGAVRFSHSELCAGPFDSPTPLAI